VTAVPTSAAFTSDFHEEFARQTDTLLRQRFLLFTAVMGTLAAVMLAGRVLLPLAPDPIGSGIRAMLPTGGRMTAYVLLSVLWAVIYAAAFYLATTKRLTAAQMLKATTILLFTDGVLGIVFRAAGLPAGGWLFFAMTHLIACILLPLTPRQAIWPVLGVAGVSALSRIFVESGGWAPHILSIAFSPIVGLPGALIAWFRHSRRVGDFKAQFFYSRYGEMRRELIDARKLHESLFPAPVSAGPVRVNYTYEPMRQIGGDFLYVFRTPADDGLGVVTNAVLLDVTGHGIPAALTVNRLHGELERVFAEDPGSGPGHVLRLLNRYVHLTLSHHSVYVTALCLRIDPTRHELAYASGGHPPAFLRAVDGTIDELHSTSLVLGAAADVDFDPLPETRSFAPGDTLIAYTDGAIECRDQTGKMLKISGLQRLVATQQATAGEWSQTVLDAVTRFRFGPPADDTLVVEIHRPLRSDSINLRMETGRAESGAGAHPAAKGETGARKMSPVS
jgi:hypothetical protein